jgi:outer membrane protein assembly factor BamB
MDLLVFLEVVFGYIVGISATVLIIWWWARQIPNAKHRRRFVVGALVVLAGSLIAVTTAGLYPYTSRPAPVPDSARLIIADVDNVHGLRAGDGSELWSSGLGFRGGTNSTMSGATIYAVGTPSASSSPASATSLFALEASDGHLVWQTPLPLGRSSGPAACGLFRRFTVLAAGNTVYTCYGSTLYAFQASDGHLIWSLAVSKVDPSDAEFAAVTAGGGDVLLLSSGADLVALSGMSGSVIWHTTKYHYTDLAISGQNLFIISDDGLLIALLIGDGSQLWITQLQSESLSYSPMAVGSRVYIPEWVNPESGECAPACWGIDAYNAQTGVLLWQSRDVLPSDGVDGGLQVGAGGIVNAYSGNSLIAVRASDGSTAWQYQPNYGGFLFVQPLSQGWFLTPSIVNGVMFLPVVWPSRAYTPNQDAITAINAQTGEYYWTQRFWNFQELMWLGVSG